VVLLVGWGPPPPPVGGAHFEGLASPVMVFHSALDEGIKSLKELDGPGVISSPPTPFQLSVSDFLADPSTP